MTKILVLDISSSAGYAVLEGELGVKPEFKCGGTIELEKTIKEYGNTGYPWTMLIAASTMADRLCDLVTLHRPEVVVVEETNLGKNRYSQKFLEFTHALTLSKLRLTADQKVVYLDTSKWRAAIGLWLNKDQKKQNAKLSKAKGASKDASGKLNIKALNAKKKELGIKGKYTWKHAAVDRANAEYDLKLQHKHNDQADAICIGLAWFNNATPCYGE